MAETSERADRPAEDGIGNTPNAFESTRPHFVMTVTQSNRRAAQTRRRLAFLSAQSAEERAEHLGGFVLEHALGDREPVVQALVV